MKAAWLAVFAVLFLALVQGQTCPNNCSGHGTCVSGYCQCASGYGGDDCSVETTILTDGVQVTGHVDSFQWHFYEYNLDTNNVALKYDLITLNQGGDCDIYLQVDDEPTRDNYRYREISTHLNVSITVPETAPRGIWIAGIYGFSPCDFIINASKISPCPNACSGHGTCNTATGVCTCDAGFSGNDCSSSDNSLVSGVPVQSSVAVGQWAHYHIAVPVSEDVLVFTVDGDADCDLYVKRAAPPTLFSWDYANATRDPHTILKIEDIAADTWYAGIYGYQACNFTITASFLNVACASNCSGYTHGSCSLGACACLTGFTGPECNTYTPSLNYGQTVEGFVNANLWNFWHFQANSEQELQIIINQTNDGDCDIYAKRGQDPTRTNYDYMDITLGHNVVLPIPEPGTDDWHIGIYGWASCSYTLQIPLVDICDCVHGTCDTNGDCICDSGWGGVECDIAVANIQRNGIQSSSVFANTWNYYHFQANTSTVVVVLKELTTTGVMWLYVSIQDVPSLRNYDYYNQETNTHFHVIEISAEGTTPWGNQDWYIGVYGNPFADQSNPSTYQLTVFYTDW